jgi:hypothetical protein
MLPSDLGATRYLMTSYRSGVASRNAWLISNHDITGPSSKHNK